MLNIYMIFVMKKLYVIRNLAFAFVVALAMPVAVLAQSENGVLFYESFNGLTGQGGNDGYFDNDEDAGVEVGAEDLETADALDNKEGWGDFVKVAICDRCVRIATKKNSGSITTPAFSVEGAAVLTFCAAAQLDDAVTLYVKVIGDAKLAYGDQSAEQIEIVLPESVKGKTSLSAQSYTVAITEASGDVRLEFSTVSTSASKQRAYLDEIKVQQGTSTGVSGILAGLNRKDVFDLQGRRVTKPGRGLYVVGGKKVMF